MRFLFTSMPSGQLMVKLYHGRPIGQTQDTPERLGPWECLGIPQEVVESVAGDKEVGADLLTFSPCCQRNQHQAKWKENAKEMINSRK